MINVLWSIRSVSLKGCKIMKPWADGIIVGNNYRLQFCLYRAILLLTFAHPLRSSDGHSHSLKPTPFIVSSSSISSSPGNVSSVSKFHMVFNLVQPSGSLGVFSILRRAFVTVRMHNSAIGLTWNCPYQRKAMKGRPLVWLPLCWTFGRTCLLKSYSIPLPPPPVLVHPPVHLSLN